MRNIEKFNFYVILLCSSFCHGSKVSYKNFEAWRKESPTCSYGKRQSPINLGPNVEKISVKNLPIKLVNYDKKPKSITILNDGHTANLTGKWSDEYPYITGELLNNEHYKFLDLHLHWGTNDNFGTEHSMHGKRYATEAHIVHIHSKYDNLGEALNDENGVVVLGILFQIDPSKTASSGIHLLAALDSAVSEINSTITTDLFKLSLFPLDSIKSFYTYKGSLTTPPCTESVRWIVLEKILPISSHSMKSLRDIKLAGQERKNVRPLQLRNNRTVILFTEEN